MWATEALLELNRNGSEWIRIYPIDRTRFVHSQNCFLDNLDLKFKKAIDILGFALDQLVTERLSSIIQIQRHELG